MTFVSGKRHEEVFVCQFLSMSQSKEHSHRESRESVSFNTS